MPEPIWWQDALAAVRRRRISAADLLAHATPTVERGQLRLEFPDTRLVADWHHSGAEAALDGALAHLGHHMPVEVISNQ